MKKFGLQKGFTLIELMVVILIIVILSTLGIVAYGEATQSARDGKRKSDIEAVRQALLLHRQDSSTGYLSAGTFPNINSSLSGTYLSAPGPVDPINAVRGGQSYVYAGSSNATTFCICANLENDRGNNTVGNCSAPGNFVTTNTGGYYCAQP